jgi:hypothetical protein
MITVYLPHCRRLGLQPSLKKDAGKGRYVFADAPAQDFVLTLSALQDGRGLSYYPDVQ